MTRIQPAEAGFARAGAISIAVSSTVRTTAAKAASIFTKPTFVGSTHHVIGSRRRRVSSHKMKGFAQEVEILRFAQKDNFATLPTP